MIAPWVFAVILVFTGLVTSWTALMGVAAATTWGREGSLRDLATAVLMLGMALLLMITIVTLVYNELAT